MTQASENRADMAATVVSLAAEATELEARVDELRHALVDLDERIDVISDALHRLPAGRELCALPTVADRP